MSYIVLMKTWRCILGLMLLASSIHALRAESRPLTAEEIIDKTVRKASSSNSTNRRAAYNYSKQSITEKVDGDGHVTERKEKRLQFEGGRGKVVQIKINGRMLSPEELKAEQQQIAEEDAKMTQSSNLSRRSDNWEQLLTPELMRRYSYRLIGEEEVSGRKAYVLMFRPGSEDLPVNQLTDRVVNQLTGKLWIDAQDFEIAQADLWLLEDVTLWGGILGSLKKFDYHIERVRLEDGVWANRLTRGEFRGRKFLGSMFVRTRSECSDFRKTVAKR